MTEREEVSGCILTVNAGSSSLKFAAFGGSHFSTRRLSGKFESVGLKEARVTVKYSDGRIDQRPLSLPSHTACVPHLFAILKESGLGIRLIAHRVVHGGPNYYEPQIVSDKVIAELKRISQFAPEHLPVEVELIEAFGAHYAGTPQVACFDTAFHRTLRTEARQLPIVVSIECPSRMAAMLAPLPR